jgi:soluble cytochrome b562
MSHKVLTDQIFIFIHIQDNGEFLTIKAQLDDPNGQFLEVPYDHQYIKEFMVYLLEQSYSYKVGTWTYDPSDGDVRFEIGQFIGDNDLTEEQLTTLIGITMRMADKGAVAIRQILETGEKPEEEEDESEKGVPDLEDLQDMVNQMKMVLSTKAAELIGEGKVEEAKAFLEQLDELEKSLIESEDSDGI